MPTDSSRAASRLHVRIALQLLALLLGTLTVVDVAARNQHLARWLDERQVRSYQANDRLFVHTRNYADFFETLFFDELPKADYSHGGVYFCGSSNVLFCSDFDDLPLEQRRLIHNYSLPMGNPSQLSHFIHYLVEHEGLLSAGGNKTQINLCLMQDDLHSEKAPGVQPGGFFGGFLNSSGFYHYDEATGITPIPMSPAEHTLRFHRTQWRSFVKRLMRMAENKSRLKNDPQANRAKALRDDATDWTQTPVQLVVLEQLLDYLKANGVHVQMIVMPTAHWYDGTPFHEGFMPNLSSVCASRNVPVLDLSHLLTDDEFMDMHHATYTGGQQVHAKLLETARAFLFSMGALATQPVLR